MEIKKENVINAYMAGDNSVKEMLRAMFPDIEFEADNRAENRPLVYGCGHRLSPLLKEQRPRHVLRKTIHRVMG